MSIKPFLCNTYTTTDIRLCKENNSHQSIRDYFLFRCFENLSPFHWHQQYILWTHYIMNCPRHHYHSFFYLPLSALYIKGNDVTKLASMAKLKAGRLVREVGDSCLQYWGGMGFTSEVLVSRFYRWVRRAGIRKDSMAWNYFKTTFSALSSKHAPLEDLESVVKTTHGLMNPYHPLRKRDGAWTKAIKEVMMLGTGYITGH